MQTMFDLLTDGVTEEEKNRKKVKNGSVGFVI